MPDKSQILTSRSRPPWGVFSFLIVASFALLKAIRLGSLPQSMDTYYHLLTAWGFSKAGGYSGWDFWQYAPIGRTHFYPPFLHFLMVFCLKTGLSPDVTGRLFEFILPVTFLIVLWYFFRHNFSPRLAFFALVLATAHFGFYFNLTAHLASTAAMIMGLLAADSLLRRKRVAAALLLAACFYTHIAVPWFFAAAFLIYGFFRKEERRSVLIMLGCVFALSLPVIFRQAVGGAGALAIGSRLQERYLCRFKPLEYLLAGWGIVAALKAKDRTGYFAVSLLLASPVLLFYPYRFLVAEGYLAIVVLAATGFDRLYQRALSSGKRYLQSALIGLLSLIFFLSPAVTMQKPLGQPGMSFGITAVDSAIVPLTLATDYGQKEQAAYFTDDFQAAAWFIERNTLPGEIVYSNLDLAGVVLAALSQRPSANALLPEVKPSAEFDPFLSSGLIVLTRDEQGEALRAVAERYGLKKIGEQRLFYFYRHPGAGVAVIRPKFVLSWFWIGTIAAAAFLAAVGLLIKKYLT